MREKLEELAQKFWTSRNEMIDEIEECGNCYIEDYGEYLAAMANDEDDEDEEILIYVGCSGNTMWITELGFTK